MDSIVLNNGIKNVGKIEKIDSSMCTCCHEENPKRFFKVTLGDGNGATVLKLCEYCTLTLGLGATQAVNSIYTSSNNK